MENKKKYTEKEVMNNPELFKKLCNEFVEELKKEENTDGLINGGIYLAGDKDFPIKFDEFDETEITPEYISVYVVDKDKSGYFTKIKNTYEDICDFLGAEDWDFFCEYFDSLNYDDEDDDSDYEGTLYCIADSTRNFQLFYAGRLNDLKQLRNTLNGRFIFVAGEDMNEFYEEIGDYYSQKLRENFEF